ncbi:MAG: hypothetical protein ACK4UJ_06895 [Leptonema sp. (in: bacteria)]
MKKLYISCIFFLLSCGSLTKEFNKIPIEKRKIYLENFTNQTFEPYVHQEMYETIREKIHLRGSLILVRDRKESSYSISTSLILFRREGLLYDNEFQPNFYQIDAIIEIRIFNKENFLIQKKEIYDSVRYSTKEGFFETDLFARRRLYDRFAYKIISSIEQSLYEENQK